MDGDLAPLHEIRSLADEYDLHCIVDEAHATGVYGQHGRGLLEHLQIESDRMMHVGTLSKAVGCVGGFVAGKRCLVEWLTNSCRSWIYSTGTVLPNAAAALVGLELVSKMQLERVQLRECSVALRNKLSSFGLRVGAGDSPIVPVYVHDAEVAMKQSQRLLQLGHYVPAIRPPTVPKGQSLLRISLSVSHSQHEIGSLTEAVKSL
jgi:8-amino-7-oxononanoate synthase